MDRTNMLMGLKRAICEALSKACSVPVDGVTVANLRQPYRREGGGVDPEALASAIEAWKTSEIPLMQIVDIIEVTSGGATMAVTGFTASWGEDTQGEAVTSLSIIFPEEFDIAA